MGLIGGIFGIIIILAFMLILNVGDIIFIGETTETTHSIVNQGWWGILLSSIGIIGASIVKHHTKVAGWLMIIAALGGIFVAGLFYILPFILLIIAGLLALIKKDTKK